MKTNLEKLLEESEVEHTATPWHNIDNYIIAYDNENLAGHGRMNSIEDAQHINHCVNAHEYLRQLAALPPELVKEMYDMNVRLDAFMQTNGLTREQSAKERENHTKALDKANQKLKEIEEK